MSLRILVSGMIAGDSWQGGATWAVLQYVLGLQRLGHDVWLVEPIDKSCDVSYFQDVVESFALSERAALLRVGTRETVGLPYEAIRRATSSADLHLNISGMLTDDELVERIPHRVYLDLDPAFNQLWHVVSGIDMRLAGHTHYATVGLGIGTRGCRIPTCGVDWIPTLPPVVLSEWPAEREITRHALTTVANWRGYGSIEHEGVHYGQKAHSVRRLIELPAGSALPFVLALSIHADEEHDLVALERNGWLLVDPLEAAGTPARYQEFVQGSWAELCIAKSGYVESRCGWFSDRSACYLASGRPVLAQDTGFGDVLPTGEGLLGFGDLESALGGIEELTRDYPRHARAARALAEEYFDSDVVLTALLDAVGAI